MKRREFLKHLAKLGALYPAIASAQMFTSSFFKKRNTGTSFAPLPPGPGTYLAVSADGFLTNKVLGIWKRSGDTFTNLYPTGHPSVINNSLSIGATAFSPSGNLLATFQDTTLYMLSRSGDTFTLENTTTLANTDAATIAWHPSGNRLAISLGASPFLRIYSVAANGALTVVPGTPTLSEAPFRLAYTPNGLNLFTGAANLKLYSVAGDVYTALPNVGIGLQGCGRNIDPTGYSLACSRDSSRVLCGNASAPYWRQYLIDSNGLTLTTAPPAWQGLSFNYGGGVAYNPVVDKIAAFTNGYASSSTQARLRNYDYSGSTITQTGAVLNTERAGVDNYYGGAVFDGTGVYLASSAPDGFVGGHTIIYKQSGTTFTSLGKLPGSDTYSYYYSQTWY